MKETSLREKLGMLVRDLTSVSYPRSKSEVKRRIEEYADDHANERSRDMLEFKDKLDDLAHKTTGIFDLEYCEKCLQMTNHLNNKCQKCK